MKGTDSIILFVNTAILFCEYLLSLYSHLYSSCDLFSSHHVICSERCWIVYPECDVLLQIWHYNTNMILHYLWQILWYHLILRVILISANLHLLLYSLYHKINNLFLYFITAASALGENIFWHFLIFFDIITIFRYSASVLFTFFHLHSIYFLFAFIFWLILYWLAFLFIFTFTFIFTFLYFYLFCRLQTCPSIKNANGKIQLRSRTLHCFNLRLVRIKTETYRSTREWERGCALRVFDWAGAKGLA